MNKLLFIAVVTSVLLSTHSYANCPDPRDVTYTCFSADSKTHCQWSAPWWEGYQGDAQVGEHPTHFSQAFWGASSNPEVGTVDCFYRDKKNNLVELSQNNWGGDEKPTSRFWKKGEWPGPESNRTMIGKVCDVNVTSCAFNY